MKRTIILILTLLVGALGAMAQKQRLSVLYVGGSSNTSLKDANGELTAKEKEMLAKSSKERFADFQQFLKAHFTTVKCINAKEWNWQMSKDYDVTIMDGRPTPLTPRTINRDENGNVLSITEAVYVPEDFDMPMFCICEASEDLGRSVGTKNDWYCLCLDAEAYNVKTEHPIFNTPNKVNLTFVEKPTPEMAFEYQFEFDQPIPKTQQMWRVQNKGYATDLGYRVGLVSRQYGYLDSPDTEIISGGVSQKSPEAIAIGRHANWFHWGFSAPPADMTEEARLVFVNAVVYASKFKGHRVIARKLHETIATSETLRNSLYTCTHQCIEDMNVMIEKRNKMIENELKRVKEKQARGEELTTQEKFIFEIKPEPAMDYETFIQQRQPELYKRFGTDERKYIDFFKSNEGYYYCHPKGYDLTVDEDAKAWQLKVGSMALLETAIQRYSSVDPQEAARAMRILEHYTLLRYTDSSDWLKWYDTYKDKIFFTESGGWLYLVNTLDKKVPGNDYNVRIQEEIEKRANETHQKKTVSLNTDENNPVAVAAECKKVSDNEYDIIIRMKVHQGYHTYAFVSDEDPYINTTLEVNPSEGYTLKGELKKPSAKVLNSTGTSIYEGEKEWHQRISGTGNGTVEVKIGWQVCNENICMQPQQRNIQVEIK